MSAHLRTQWNRLVTAAPARLFHGTDVVLQPGDVLEPGGRTNYQDHLYGGAAGKVFMADDAEMAFFYAVMGAISQGNFDRNPHVYEVTAPEASYNQPGEWVASTAIVVREVTSEAKAALKAQWDSWKVMIENLVPPGPGRAMTIYEFERAIR